MTGRILLADDERDILEPVSYALAQHGFDVTCVESGDAALERARSGEFDLLLCDVMMPGTLGTDVCRILRAESDLPIILLTARDAEVDRVLGLELGADDYVTKPFSTSELVSRVRALLRRRELDRASGGGATKSVGGLRIDYTRHLVEVDGTRVKLTPSEFNLLGLLAEEPERVFTRAQIMDHLWQTPHVGDARACDVHISNLRRKIERDPSHPARIITVREFGYKLMPV
jgi:two-component system response regulator RegX3